MKGIIGILGGMGPEATADAFSRLIKNTPADNDQQHIPVIISSLPDIPDRSACILQGSASPYPRMLQSLKILENAGVACIIITCNTAHYWFDELKKQTAVPMINMIDVTCNKIIRENTKKVALLATTATVSANMYQSRLANNNIDCVIPLQNEQQQVMQSIYSLKAGNVSQARAMLLPVAYNILTRGVEKIILGCTELPIILQNETGKDPESYINSTVELINSAIDWHFNHKQE